MATAVLPGPEHVVNSHNSVTVGRVGISAVFRGAVDAVNRGATALITSPRWGRLVGLGLTQISYVGRRSGRTIRLPVGYRRRGQQIVIGVAMPDGKNGGATSPATAHR